MNDDRPKSRAPLDGGASDDNRLLEALSDHVRDEGRRDAERFGKYHGLTEGRLSEAERSVLEAEAGRTEEGRLDYEAFRPLDDGFRSKMIQRVQQEIGSAPQPAAPQPAAPQPAAPQPAAPQPAAPPQYPVWLPLAAAVLLAMGGWWLVGRSTNTSPLPTFTAELGRGLQDTRSADPGAGVPTFQLGDAFELVLRPEEAVAHELQTGFWLVKSDEPGGEAKARPWQVGYSSSPEGTLRIRGSLGTDLPIEAGAYRLIFLYGRPGKLPANPLTDPDGVHWRRLEAQFRVEEAASPQPIAQ